MISDDEPDETDSVAVMSLGDHVEALRSRLIWAISGVGLISILMFLQGRGLVWWICQPLFVAQRQLGLPLQTVNLSVAGGFAVYVKVSLVAGLALGAPWVAYQMWRFVAPGLRRHERRVFRLLVPYSAVMTAAALGFLYYLFLPAAISFLLLFSLNYPSPVQDAGGQSSLERVTAWCNRLNAALIPGASRSLTPSGSESVQSTGDGQTPARGLRLQMLTQDPASPQDGEIWFNRSRGEIRFCDQGRTRILPLASPSLMTPMVEINEYLGFVLWVALVLVIAFQLPVVMTVAASMGLLDPRALAQRRAYIAFACFLIGIIITPNQDIISNIVFPIMLWGLFELGLLTSYLVSLRSARCQT